MLGRGKESVYIYCSRNSGYINENIKKNKLLAPGKLRFYGERWAININYFDTQTVLRGHAGTLTSIFDLMLLNLESLME